MARTTLDIDDPILRDLRELQKKERKSLGRLVSDLLARALARPKPRQPRSLTWIARPMNAKVDLTDKDALYAALDRKG
jgi:hypothetical protein